MTAADLQRVRDHAESALKLMGDHKLAPLPDNYAVWFTYAAGSIPDLTRAVDERIAAGGVTQEDCARIHAQFVAGGAAEQTMLEIGNSVSAELANVQSILETASRDTSSYGNTLQGVSGQLTKAEDPALMKVVIDNLVQATRTMASRSQKLEQRLRQSKDEVDRLQKNIETARTEARTDGLTQLANRTAFDEVLRNALGDASTGKDSLCLIMGDIDHFKKFNDTWGHQTGDQVLRLVAHCMRESVRHSDIPARYGGEEFAVVLPGAPLEAATQVAERIRWNVESKRVMKRSTGEDLGTITMSLGVALYKPGEDSASIVQRADACLYAAKRSGRNRVLTDKQVDTNAIKAETQASKAVAG